MPQVRGIAGQGMAEEEGGMMNELPEIDWIDLARTVVGVPKANAKDGIASIASMQMERMLEIRALNWLNSTFAQKQRIDEDWEETERQKAYLAKILVMYTKEVYEPIGQMIKQYERIAHDAVNLSMPTILITKDSK
jgi:hypothetical protein